MQCVVKTKRIQKIKENVLHIIYIFTIIDFFLLRHLPFKYKQMK